MNTNIETLADNGLRMFTENSKWWKKVFDDASPAVKKYLRYLWGAQALNYNNEDGKEMPPEYHDLMKHSASIGSSEFVKSDWKYLMDITTVPQKRAFYDSMMNGCKSE